MSQYQLETADLVAPLRQRHKILLPNEIPLHPAVLQANFAFTREYVEEVCSALPEAIRRDVSEIERILGSPLAVEVTETTISEKFPGCRSGYEYSFQGELEGDFEYLVRPHSLDVSCGSANIGMDNQVGRMIVQELLPLRPHPMAKDKWQHYAVPASLKKGNGDNPQYVFWYIHNISDGILPLELYFRNFAMQFNNKGLERLGKYSGKS